MAMDMNIDRDMGKYMNIDMETWDCKQELTTVFDAVGDWLGKTTGRLSFYTS
jgi:hypothetical protein